MQTENVHPKNVIAIFDENIQSPVEDRLLELSNKGYDVKEYGVRSETYDYSSNAALEWLESVGAEAFFFVID